MNADGRGGEPVRGVAPPARTWHDRVRDPLEPLFTIAVTIDLLGTNHQTLRRLESAIDFSSTRPSGNQRRYSLRDLELLAAACALSDQGFSPVAVGKILALRAK